MSESDFSIESRFKHTSFAKFGLFTMCVLVAGVFLISLVENYSEFYLCFFVALIVALVYLVVKYWKGETVLGSDFVERKVFRTRRIYFRDVTEFSKSWIRPTLSSPDCSMIFGPDTERQGELLDAIEHRLRSRGRGHVVW